MRMRIAALTLAVSFGTGVSLGSIGVSGLGVVPAFAEEADDDAWLWKDLEGDCPALCDPYVYACPCHGDPPPVPCCVET